MKKAGTLFLVSLLVSGIFLFIPGRAYSIYFGKDAAKQAEQEFAPGRLIVKLKPGADEKVVVGDVGGIVTTGLAEFDQLNVRFSVGKQGKLFNDFRETALKSEKLSSVYVLEVPEGTDLLQMRAEYENLPQVEYAELDYRMELFQEPDDPLFPHQWYLNNLGAEQNGGQGYYGIDRAAGHQLVMKFGTEDADIDALEAFQREDEVIIPLVGMIDTGVDLDHEDLAGNIWTNPGEDLNGNGLIDPSDTNGIDDDHNGFADDFHGWDFSGDSALIIPVGDNDPTDYYGHGTHCAGIVAAIRDNTVGVSGINSPCKIMAIKFFPNSFVYAAAKSIIYAADMGCDVINMSWGTPYPSELIEDALDYAIDRGVLPIAASGNDGQEQYNYPASFDSVFTVGASNSDDQVTDFSTFGEHIEVVAPGRDILSLRADFTHMYGFGGHIIDEHYYLADGTSMAAPCAVGVAASIMAASPGISNQRVMEIIQESADDIIYPYGGDTLYSPGKDIYSGYGRVNLNSALQLLAGRLARIVYPYENAILTGDVAVFGTASGYNFENYVLEYGEGYSPVEWTEITNSDIPVSNDTLGLWSTGSLAGRYTLRLTVGEQNQAEVHVILSNDVYVQITSPSENDTVEGYTQVYGYTVVPDFSHYTLECGAGHSPSSWDTIATSTRMSADDLLGNWVVSFSEGADYTLRLTAETNTGPSYSDSVKVFVVSIASDVWVQQLSSYGSLSPAVGDIDGDGFDEVVLGVGGLPGWGLTGGVEVFSHEGEPEADWPKDTDKNMMSSPALGDLDDDGMDDIVICSEQEGVHTYLSGSPDWVRSASTVGNELWSLATPVIADLENDGSPEVLMANKSARVYAWRNDGESVIPGNNGVFAQTVTCGSEGFPNVAVADLDKDGENEVIAGVAFHYGVGGVYVWDIDGNSLLAPGDYPETFTEVFGIAIANMDENEDLEIIVFGMNRSCGTLCAFKKDGTQPANYPILLEDLEPGWWFGNHPAVGDLEGDGILEIVVSPWTLIEARIYAWHQDGTPLGSVGSGLLASVKSPNSERKKELLMSLGSNIAEVVARIRSMSKEELDALFSSFDEDPVFASVAETFGSTVLADVNGDNKVDIMVRAGYYYGIGHEEVYAWDFEGNIIPGFPLYASAEPGSQLYMPFSPVMSDMDKDGKLNMLLLTGYPDFRLLSWEFDTDYSTLYSNWFRCWPKYMHDKWNSGVFEKKCFTGYSVAFVVYLIDYIFRAGLPPVPFEFGDVNCDANVDIVDVVYLINYLFKGGPPPCH